jgi:acyl-CoA synthetase (AMP-forming)/AMP-acid ligase II
MENFAHTLQAAADVTPEHPAVTLLFNDRAPEVLTAAGLLAGSAAYARLLAEAGIAPDAVVVVILPHGRDLICAFWGAVLRGAIPTIMPFLTEKLSPTAYRQNLQSLFAITQPGAVITYPEFVEEVRGAAPSLPVLSCAAVPPAALPRPEEADLFAGFARPPAEIALLQHSSGTTGLQKGVALSQTAIINQLDAYAAAIQLTEDDGVVSWLPLYHDMGLIAGFLLPILRGLPLTLMSPFDWVRAPQRLFHALTSSGGTLVWLPNFAYNFCAQKIRARDLVGVDLSRVRAVINTSEPIHLDSHEQFAARFAPYGLRPEALATSYGMAENVFAITQGGITAPVMIDWIDGGLLAEGGLAQPLAAADGGAPRVSVGRPIANTEVCILDDHGALLPERHLGEVAMRSTSMLTGYYHRPDLDAAAFHDGWFLTGDLGYLAAGEVYITGRKKDVIIVAGKNIYPQDLERLAGEVTGVHPGRVVAFGVFDEAAGTEEVVLLAELDAAPEAQAQIETAIQERVTRGSDIAVRRVHGLPRGWLLKTSSGKIARAANREKFLAEFGR